jgi:hypothetical protein
MRFHDDADWEGLALSVVLLAMADRIAIKHRIACRAYLVAWSNKKKRGGYEPATKEYFDRERDKLLAWAHDGGGKLIDGFELAEWWNRAGVKTHRNQAARRARRLHAIATGGIFSRAR